MNHDYSQISFADAIKEFGSDASTGLNGEFATKRLLENGENALQEQKAKTPLGMFLAQLNDPMIFILFAAAAISIFLKEVSDAVIILIVILINAIIGVIQEGKAQKALEALKKLSSPIALVQRDGKRKEIPAAGLVVGDIIILEAGRQVPADIRLTMTANLKVEESALTGESVPVDKSADYIADSKQSIGDRINMAYMTTNVSYGRGEGVVVATGMQTEIGKIAQMINESKDEMTPLQKRLADLGKLLGVLAVILCVALFIIAVVQGRDISEMLITAISLAVAAVPEGLPAIVTIVLALGVQRLVKVNAIVRRLPSVETLGSVSVVCSDKTGTLTQNKMTVVRYYENGIIEETNQLKLQKSELFIKGFLLCNDASTLHDQRLGDPTELALLDLASRYSLVREDLEKEMPRINEQAFDSDRKMMTTVHSTNQMGATKCIAFTKGAIDQILKHCTKLQVNGKAIPITDEHKDDILSESRLMSQEALRVLALAIRIDEDSATEEELTFVGMVGMIDPARPEAAAAVKVFKGASVKTVMITGDHIDTAFAIAKNLGIAEDISQCISGDTLDTMSEEDLSERIDHLCVFARVSPEHKVLIVNAFRKKGNVVSMTGDGVNDAPSLKAADIGVAMGITGTDVAKAAADMVLADDNFATIERAIVEGRGIYANIKKSVLFLLSSNFGEIITMFLTILVGLAAPLKAIHILWVNLITDSLPGLALGVDQNEQDDVMLVPPRNPKESLFANGGLAITLFYGVVIAALTLTAFLTPTLRELGHLGSSFTITNIADMLNSTTLAEAQTYAFTVLALSQLFHAIGMRNVDKSIFKMNHLANKMMIFAFVIGFVLQVAVTEIPFLINVFGTDKLSLNEWFYLTALAVVPLVVHEIIVVIKILSKSK